jgi:hypothetical protein
MIRCACQRPPSETSREIELLFFEWFEHHKWRLPVQLYGDSTYVDGFGQLKFPDTMLPSNDALLKVVMPGHGGRCPLPH